ncbi:MAG: ABC transporter permease [Coriobacteriaceae bacterium]|nr:ABC transporter permease [Coriobacteriaceae bacterium]
MDYLKALGLSSEQADALGSAGDVLQAFSVFTVIVFMFLVRYADHFLLRRRAREFALYELMGMDTGAVSSILLFEGVLVGTTALVGGVALGALLSPAFGAIAAFVFGVSWRFVFSFSPDAAAWTALCFAAVFAVNAAGDARMVARKPLIELVAARRTPERAHVTGGLASMVRLALAVLLLGVVWGSCLLQPVYFIAFIIPMGFAACIATALVAQLGVVRWAEASRRRGGRYWRGVRVFTVRQVESRVTSTSMALACACVLIAAAVCMMVAGFALSVGLRTSEMISSGVADSLAPIGFIGIFYGSVFLLAAVAVLSLQQLSGVADSRGAFRTLAQLGCERSDMRASLRTQVRLCFAAPLLGALVHDVFGFALVAFLSSALGVQSFASIVAGVLALTVGFIGVYSLLTERAAERLALP